ncbi:MAG: hypothetical protein NDJ94_04965 [Vicinamibacteria bacterium]|jgi:hypothetical protein|nr:hypothetical protein [Vicinamibacteria bacterium]
MLKKMFAALALVALFAAPSFAADEPAKNVLNGTISAIDGIAVEVTVEGEKPAWVKKGSGVKFEGGVGKLVDVTATTVKFNSKKASTLKVGDKIAIQKGASVPAGC